MPACRCASPSGERSSAARRSPRNSIPAFATRPRATPSACSTPRSSATSASRNTGSSIRERPFANFLPLPDGDYLKVGGGVEATQAEIARFSRRDADALPAYYDMLERVADVLRGHAARDAAQLSARVRRATSRRWSRSSRRARAFARCSLPERRDLLDLFTKSAGDVLDRWFESAPIKAAFGFDAVVGNFASPYTPGSAYVLLHHVFGEVNGKRGQWGHAVGGMGAITQAMAAECTARGVDDPHQRAGGARPREGGASRGRRARKRRRDRGRARGRQRESEAPVPAPRRARARARGFSRAHRRLPLRLGHVPHERRAVGAAELRRAARRRGGAASRERHHHGAVARATWSARTSTRARAAGRASPSSRC